MAERVLVAGIGNIFLSDDGFGSAVVGELLSRRVPEDTRVVDYGIRGVHLAFDLDPSVETLILVDTVPEAAGESGSLVVLEVDLDRFAADQVEVERIDGATVDAHSMDPGSVFRSLAAMTDARPHTLVVGCQPETVEDGIGLSDVVAAAVPTAAEKVLELVARRLSNPVPGGPATGRTPPGTPENGAES